MEETTKESNKYIKTKKIRIKDGAQLVSTPYSMRVFPRDMCSLLLNKLYSFRCRIQNAKASFRTFEVYTCFRLLC